MRMTSGLVELDVSCMTYAPLATPSMVVLARVGMLWRDRASTDGRRLIDKRMKTEAVSLRNSKNHEGVSIQVGDRLKIKSLSEDF